MAMPAPHAALRWRRSPVLPTSGLGKLLAAEETTMAARAQCTPPGLTHPAWHCTSQLRLPINPINQHPPEVLIRAPQALP